MNVICEANSWKGKKFGEMQTGTGTYCVLNDHAIFLIRKFHTLIVTEFSHSVQLYNDSMLEGEF